MASSDVMSLILIHEQPDVRDTGNLHCFLFSSVLFADCTFLIIIVRPVIVFQCIFCQSPSSVQSFPFKQLHRLNKINRRSQSFHQINSRPNSNSNHKPIPHWGTIEMCCKNMLRKCCSHRFELFSADRSIKASFYNVRSLQRQRGVCICSQNTNITALPRRNTNTKTNTNTNVNRNTLRLHMYICVSKKSNSFNLCVININVI